MCADSQRTLSYTAILLVYLMDRTMVNGGAENMTLDVENLKSLKAIRRKPETD